MKNWNYGKKGEGKEETGKRWTGINAGKRQSSFGRVSLTGDIGAQIEGGRKDKMRQQELHKERGWGGLGKGWEDRKDGSNTMVKECRMDHEVKELQKRRWMKLNRERWASRSGERYTMESGLRKEARPGGVQYKRCEEAGGRLGWRVHVSTSKSKRWKHGD
jgi:hypothetical protein